MSLDLKALDDMVLMDRPCALLLSVVAGVGCVCGWPISSDLVRHATDTWFVSSLHHLLPTTDQANLHPNKASPGSNQVGSLVLRNCLMIP